MKKRSLLLVARILKSSFLVIMTSLLFGVAQAGSEQSHPVYFNLEGILTDVVGDPILDLSVDFRIKIYNPSKTCLLYEETHLGVDLDASKGHFNFFVGSNTGDPVRAGADPGLSMRDVFANNMSYIGCYTPTAGDSREIEITATPSSTGNPETLPTFSMGSVPFASVATSLQGLLPEDLIQVNSSAGLTQANIESLVNGSDIGSALHHHDSHNDSRYLPIGSANPVNLGSGNVTTSGVFEIESSDPQMIIDDSSSSSNGRIEFHSSGSPMAVIQSSSTTNDLQIFNNGGIAINIDSSRNVSMSQSLNVSNGISSEADLNLNNQSALKLKDADNSHYVGFRSPASVTSSILWTMPDSDGSNGEVLTTNGSGLLSWSPLGGGGDLISTNNLSDVNDVALSRTNLGLGDSATGTIGIDVQAYDAQLSDIAGLAPTDGHFVVGNGSNFVLETGSVARSSLGLGTMATETATDYLNKTGNLSGVVDPSVARSNLGLGNASTANVGSASGDVMGAAAVPNCLAGQKLQMSLGPTYVWSCVTDKDTTDHSALSNLTNDDHTQYIHKDGRAGGQVLFGGVAANDSLVLDSTSHATKGDILINPTGSTGRVGIGTPTPQEPLHVAGNIKVDGSLQLNDNPTAVCDSNPTNGGKIRYNITTGNLEFCNHIAGQWYKVTATAMDDTPDLFTFTDQLHQSSSTLIYAPAIYIYGFDGPLVASVSGDGSPQICNHSTGCSWSTSVDVNDGDQIQIRTMSASADSTSHFVNVNIGTMMDNWEVRTSSPPVLCDGGSPVIGDRCTDGSKTTIYAGTFSGYNLMVTPGGCTDTTDPNCSGTDTLSKVFGASGTATGATSLTDGQSNTSLLTGYAGTTGAQYCDNLVYAGFTDWYLPAVNELSYIYIYRDAIGGFQSSYYLSSTEVSSVNYYEFSFSSGASVSYSKSSSYPDKVRCVRKY